VRADGVVAEVVVFIGFRGGGSYRSVIRGDTFEQADERARKNIEKIYERVKEKLPIMLCDDDGRPSAVIAYEHVALAFVDLPSSPPQPPYKMQ
jgi:hypothetical protein